MTQLTLNADSFTRLKQTAEGTLAPSSLERLDEYLVSDDGELSYRVRGSAVMGSDGRELRKLVLEVKGWVMLEDEVTLQPLRYDIDLAAKLVLVRSEAELPPLEAESDDEDYIVVDREIDLAALVEDEVILDLPMIPGDGSGVPPDGAESSDEAGEMAASKPSPFAALAALKKTNS